MNISRNLVIALVAMAASPLLAQQSTGVALRRIDTDRGHPVAVMLPLSQGSLVETLILRAAAAAAVPVGIERVIDEPLPPGVVAVRRNPQRVTLSDRPLADALDLAVSQAAAIAGPREEHRLSWNDDGGIVHIRPFQGSRPSFLDTVIPSFELTDAPLPKALTAVHLLVNPSYREPSGDGLSVRMGINGAGGLGGDVIGSPPPLARVTVRLEKATIRAVLDAIVLRTGRLSWIVRFVDATVSTRARRSPSQASMEYRWAHRLDVDLDGLQRRRRQSACRPAAALFGLAMTLFPMVQVSSQGKPPGLEEPGTPPRLLLTTPVTTVGLRGTLLRLSVLTKTALGLEIAGQGSMSPPRDSASAAPRIEYALELTGLPITESLERIVSVKQTAAGRYEWASDRGVYNVRPVAYRNNRSVALNRMVPRFESSRSDLRLLLKDAHRIFDGDYPMQVGTARRMPPGARSWVERPITVSMTNASVRAILNEIARQHGGLTWLAEYSDAAGGYEGLRLSFHAFDNWSVGAIARPSRR